MKPKPAKSRTETRAEGYFMLYYALGHERSLKKLCQYCREIGAKISMQTLFLWSSRFNWQLRSRQIELEAAEKLRKDRIAETKELLQLEFEIGKEMLNIVQKALHQMVEDNVRLSPGDVVRFAVAGAEIERNALLGEQPSYAEQLKTEINSLIITACNIFMSTNEIEDKEERKKRFAVEFNRAIQGQVRLLEG